MPSFSLVGLPSSGEGGNVFPQTRTWNSLSRKKSFSKKENIRKEIKREEMLASFFYELFFCAQDIKWSLERYWWAMGYPYSAVCSYSKGSPFLKCVGSIWALPKSLKSSVLCQMYKRGKKVFQTILASPYIPGQIYANKMLQTIIASLYTSPILRKRGYS